MTRIGTTFFARRLCVGVCAAAAVVAMSLVGACTPSTPANTAERPRFVALILDETESFAKIWPEMLKAAGFVAKRLGPSAGMVVIGLDDQGFQPDDVRVPVRILDYSSLKAKVEGDRLARDISQLQRRPAKRPFTDVLGAIRHAAYFLNRQPDHEPMLIVFSDMRQTPRAPTVADVEGLSFPAGTTAHCFYVDAAGWRDWQNSVTSWQGLLGRAGVTMTADNFHQQGETDSELRRLFPSSF